MSTVKTELKQCLLNFPTIFPNALSVYNHWFCTNGNGYEWKNGQLVDVCTSKSYKAGTVKTAVINYMKRELIDEWKKEHGNIKRFADSYLALKNDISEFVIYENQTVIDNVKLILDVKNRMKDFSVSVIDDKFFGIHRKFEFYPLCEYSKMYCAPDDIQPDWLYAIKKMIDIIEQHKDRLRDNHNLFDEIKEHIKEIYQKQGLFYN